MDTNTEVITVGRDEEKVLIDYMSQGSKVALLMFDLAMIKLAVKRNCAPNTLLLMEADANYHAQEVLKRVEAVAFFAKF